MAKKVDIELGLSALCQAALPEETLSIKDIADVCNCRMQTIFAIQARAIAKMKRNPLLKKHIEDLA